MGGDQGAVLVAAILVVIFLLGISRAPTHAAGACRCSAWPGITFASLALVFNALAKGYDFFTYYFTLVLTPMTFLSGVYFPIAADAALAAGESPRCCRSRPPSIWSGRSFWATCPPIPSGRSSSSQGMHAAATIWRWCSPGAGSSDSGAS